MLGRETVKSSDQSDEFNQIRMCFIDQYERKLSCHLHCHGIHQKSKWKTNSIQSSIIIIIIYKKNTQVYVKVLCGLKKNLVFPPHTSRTDQVNRSRRGVPAKYMCLQIYLRINVSRHPTLLKPVCGKHCTCSQIWNLTRPRHNDFITVS